MKNTTPMFMALCALTLLILSGCGTKTDTTMPIQENAADKTPIKIGWIGPLTGAGSAYGLMELNAAKIAVKDINDAGGINGRQIELSVEDGKCDGPTTVTATNKLTEVDNVKYIAGRPLFDRDICDDTHNRIEESDDCRAHKFRQVHWIGELFVPHNAPLNQSILRILETSHIRPAVGRSPPYLNRRISPTASFVSSQNHSKNTAGGS